MLICCGGRGASSDDCTLLSVVTKAVAREREIHAHKTCTYMYSYVVLSIVLH